MPEKFPVASVQVALTGATYVELVAHPPKDVAYRIRNVYGENTTGSSRVLHLAFNNAGTRTVVFHSHAAVQDHLWTHDDVDNVGIIGLVLSSTDHSLDMKLDGAGTDTIVCSYEIMEAE